MSGSDTITGGSSATYDLDGSVVRETWAAAVGGALTATTLTDTTDTPVSKTWVRGFSTILTNTVGENGHGQTVTDSTAMPTLSTTVAGSQRDRRYAYDANGRLTSAADGRRVAPASGGNAVTQCTTRAWGFDANSNRSAKGSATSSSGCPSTGYSAPSLNAGHSYDSADRITDATGGVGTLYDAFGRTRELGSTTNNTPAGGAGGTVKLTQVGYTVMDMALSQTLYAGSLQGTGVEASQSWSVDPTGSRFAGSVITRGGVSTTKMYRYDSTDDSPALIDEGDGTTTRPVTDLGGGMTAITSVNASGAVGVTWQLSNLHGDVAATLANTSSAAPAPLPAADEYGKILDAVTGTPARYSWLGAKQRSAENISGLVLMGVRLYNTTNGRFLSLDPVPGGNANAYTYPVDPINQMDLDGRFAWGKWADRALLVGGILTLFVCTVCAVVVAVGSVARGAYKVGVKKDNSGWWDIAGGLTFGVGKALKPAGAAVRRWALGRNPGGVAGRERTAAVKRYNINRAHGRFGRGVKAYGKLEVGFGTYTSGKGVCDEY